MFERKTILKKFAALGGLTVLMGLFLFGYKRIDHTYSLTERVGETLRGPVSREYLRSPLIPLRTVKYIYKYHRANGESLASSILHVFGIGNDEGIARAEASHALSVPVFVYHGIVSTADRFSMTEATFTDQMFALKRAGYQSIGLNDLQAFLAGEGTLPEKPFLLTFDDGRLDSYRLADPVLQALDYKAVMFVASGASIPDVIGARSSYYIVPDDIHHMINSGRWEIGSHAIQKKGGYVALDAEGTRANFLSSRQWLNDAIGLETVDEYAARVSEELSASKSILEKTFGIKVEAFSYPFGDYGQQSKNTSAAMSTISTVVAQNYYMAFRQVWPDDGEYTFNFTDTEKLRLKRVETQTDWTGTRFVAFLEAAQEKALPYLEDFSSEYGWKGSWGEVQLDKSGLHLAANSSSSGAAAFLDGSRTWTNYKYDAVVDWRNGSHVSLLARYHDGKNYVVCTYGDGRVKIERIINGRAIKLNETALPRAHEGGETMISIQVDGESAECFFSGVAKISAHIPADSGGIGILIWDQKLKNADVFLKNISVVPTGIGKE